jgi:hypothetical protein
MRLLTVIDLDYVSKRSKHETMQDARQDMNL